MEELIQTLSKMLKEGVIPSNLKVTKTDNGNFLLEIPNAYLLQHKIQEELDNLSNDIFKEAYINFSTSNSEDSHILQNMRSYTESEIQNAFDKFKKCVNSIIHKNIKSHQEAIDKLTKQYMK